MAKIRDRTEDFKDAVNRGALSLGFNEAKRAALMASFIMHKPRERSPFTKAALKTLESIGTLEQFLIKHRKDYVDPHRTTEEERDSIEHEVSVFVKACKEQIDILKSSITDEEANGKGWLGIRGDNANADTVAHKHGVVLILSESLHSVTSQFDQLRAVRFQEAINRAMPRRKPKRAPLEKTETTSSSETRDQSEITTEPMKVQQQVLDDETRALQVELSSLLDAARDTETKMVEMSALNHLMSTHVLQQAQQIEYLYDQAVEATKNVEMGNKELSQAIERNSSSRVFLLLFIAVFTFTILFLDCEHWVNTFNWFEPIVKPHVEPNVNPLVEPNVEPPVEPNVQPHMEPNFETHVEDVSGGEVIDTVDSEDIEDNTNSDFIVDEDNMLDDPNVDMKDFHLNIDKEVEWELTDMPCKYTIAAIWDMRLNNEDARIAET
ncbi:unnamed protein product [Lactuca saligna]|uniref:SNARE-complex protein Syntaxin-18 N-terminal domain-containing protein n=1 Tax=Lactuca saligna TaxID=75948 RepID=A0AA36EHK8_LACSI|nr:unnamed protein product [Lactuca saligna]